MLTLQERERIGILTLITVLLRLMGIVIQLLQRIGKRKENDLWIT